MGQQKFCIVLYSYNICRGLDFCLLDTELKLFEGRKHLVGLCNIYLAFHDMLPPVN